MRDPLLVISCGALAREVAQLRKIKGFEHLHLKCIDARLHNRPDEIPAELRKKIRKYRGQYANIYVAYGDCGTCGGIDRVVEVEGVERLPGAHCYQIFAGQEAFARLADDEPGTFYLTDFLVRNFDRLVIKALKLDKHPELLPDFFGNYRRIVYLAQTECQDLQNAASRAAAYLGLRYKYVFTGYGGLEYGLRQALSQRDTCPETQK
ncbi:MAG: DUF1638 domain-containing protein [Gammaproteobacteria bacterium]